MKNALYTAFKILLFAVILGKALNIFLDFSDETNRLLNISMFTLIGIAYIVMGYVWDNKLLKTIIISCGVFLIAMNFFRGHMIISIIGIVCILVPMFIAKFRKGTKDEPRVAEP